MGSSFIFVDHTLITWCIVMWEDHKDFQRLNSCSLESVSSSKSDFPFFDVTETWPRFWQGGGSSHSDEGCQMEVGVRGDEHALSLSRRESSVGYCCPYCGKRIMIRHHFIGHLNGHLNVKPHRCHRCSRSFAYGTSLSRHKRTCKGASQGLKDMWQICSRLLQYTCVSRNLAVEIFYLLVFPPNFCRCRSTWFPLCSLCFV